LTFVSSRPDQHLLLARQGRALCVTQVRDPILTLDLGESGSRGEYTI
jgi:hypothetical protein